MVNIPRQKGTSAETAVVSFLRSHGWPYAERRALRGSADHGDVTGCPGLVWEVKYANGGIRMAEWMSQTLAEQRNDNAEYGILVIKPEGLGAKSVDRWPVVMQHNQFDALTHQALAALLSANMELAAGEVARTVYNGPYAYSQEQLLASVADSATVSAERALCVSLHQPRGTKNDEGSWLVATTLAQMCLILRMAGYGSTIGAA